MAVSVPSPTGYGALYYPTGGQMQPDPFQGRFGNNPGLLSYLLAANQPMWGAPAAAGGNGGAGGTGGTGTGGTTPPPGTGGTPPPGTPGSGSGGGFPGGGGGHGNDSSGYHGSSATGATGGGLGGILGGGQWAGPGQVNLGQLGRYAMTAGSMIPGPIGMGIGLANMGIRGYNEGQFNNQANAVGVPGLSFGQMLGGVLGLNGYGSGNWGANGVIGMAGVNADHPGTGLGANPGDALGGYNGQGRPSSIGPIGGPFGALNGASGLGIGGGGGSGNNGGGARGGGIGGNGPAGGQGGQGKNAGF